MPKEFYRKIAHLVQARINCDTFNPRNVEWFDKHEARLNELVAEFLPHGSGFDNGTTLDLDKSTSEKLIFYTSFHHMDENGGYDGWTDHSIIVTASLVYGFNLRVTGRDRNDIKDYIATRFNDALTEVFA